MQTSDIDLDLVPTESLKLKRLGYAHLESPSLIFFLCVPMKNISAESILHAYKLILEKSIISLGSTARTTRRHVCT
jgi:hypothetical protein